MKLEAIILCGGLGTRIKDSLPPNTPKCMADINGKPFLSVLLTALEPYISKVILSTGHGHEKVIDYFDLKFNDIPLIYRPFTRGTGDAVRNCLCNAALIGPHILIVNGDTFFEDYSFLTPMLEYHQKKASFSLAFSMIKRQHAGIDILDKKPGYARRASIFPVDQDFIDIGTPEGLTLMRLRQNQ